MADFYRTVDGDRIDLICQRHYGSLDMLPQVLEANIELVDRSMILDAGIEITLPRAPQKTQDKIPATPPAGVPLW